MNLKIDPKAKAFLVGLGVAVLLVLGQALIAFNANPAVDVRLWLHTLGATMAGSVGTYIVNRLSSAAAG